MSQEIEFRNLNQASTLSEITNDTKVVVLEDGVTKQTDASNFNELPPVTGTDNGKVLGVSGGVWGKYNIPSQLPAVTSDDNGDVLTVVEGAWAKAAPSGGNNDFVVTYTEDEHENIVCDKTFAEISAAITAGKNVKAKWVTFGDGFFVFNEVFEYGSSLRRIKYLSFEALNTRFTGGNSIPNSVEEVQVWFINHDEDENITGYYQTIWQSNS